MVVLFCAYGGIGKRRCYLSVGKDDSYFIALKHSTVLGICKGIDSLGASARGLIVSSGDIKEDQVIRAVLGSLVGHGLCSVSLNEGRICVLSLRSYKIPIFVNELYCKLLIIDAIYTENDAVLASVLVSLSANSKDLILNNDLRDLLGRLYVEVYVLRSLFGHLVDQRLEGLCANYAACLFFIFYVYRLSQRKSCLGLDSIHFGNVYGSICGFTVLIRTYEDNGALA